MRDELFRYYVELGHKLNYYRAYSISARRIKNAYSGFLMLVSAAGIATLSCWDKLPILWSVIALSAQVLQVLQPLTQSAKQKEALKYIIQDTSKIFDDVRELWDSVGAYEIPAGCDFYKELAKFRRREDDVIERFASDLDFPHKKRLEKKAKENNSDYFRYHYNAHIAEEW